MENLLNYPQSCIVDRVVPKTMFYKFMDVNPRMKTRFVNDVVSITWLYKLSAQTLNVTASADIPEIQIFVATLKTNDCPKDLFLFLDQSLPQYIVFILIYEGSAMFMLNYKEHLESEKKAFNIKQTFTSCWQDNAELSLPVQGQSLQRIYDNFVAHISGIGEHKAGAMAEIVELKQRIAKMDAELKSLQAKVRKEKQFSVQMEMNKLVKAKRKELTKLKEKLDNLK